MFTVLDIQQIAALLPPSVPTLGPFPTTKSVAVPIRKVTAMTISRHKACKEWRPWWALQPYSKKAVGLNPGLGPLYVVLFTSVWLLWLPPTGQKYAYKVSWCSKLNQWNWTCFVILKTLSWRGLLVENLFVFQDHSPVTLIQLALVQDDLDEWEPSQTPDVPFDLTVSVDGCLSQYGPVMSCPLVQGVAMSSPYGSWHRLQQTLMTLSSLARIWKNEWKKTTFI